LPCRGQGITPGILARRTTGDKLATAEFFMRRMLSQYLGLAGTIDEALD